MGSDVVAVFPTGKPALSVGGQVTVQVGPEGGALVVLVGPVLVVVVVVVAPLTVQICWTSLSVHCQV